jgi:hypothetical protein
MRLASAVHAEFRNLALWLNTEAFAEVAAHRFAMTRLALAVNLIPS